MISGLPMHVHTHKHTHNHRDARLDLSGQLCSDTLYRGSWALWKSTFPSDIGKEFQTDRVVSETAIRTAYVLPDPASWAYKPADIHHQGNALPTWPGGLELYPFSVCADHSGPASVEAPDQLASRLLPDPGSLPEKSVLASPSSCSLDPDNSCGRQIILLIGFVLLTARGPL